MGGKRRIINTRKILSKHSVNRKTRTLRTTNNLDAKVTLKKPQIKTNKQKKTQTNRATRLFTHIKTLKLDINQENYNYSAKCIHLFWVITENWQDLNCWNVKIHNHNLSSEICELCFENENWAIHFRFSKNWGNRVLFSVCAIGQCENSVSEWSLSIISWPAVFWSKMYNYNL